MMKLNEVKSQTFVNERNPEEVLTVRKTNFGEPYDEGISLEMRDGYTPGVSVELTSEEVKSLRAFLNELCEGHK